MNSAIVLNWNELEVSKDSVRKLIKEGHDVILVDNASTDGSQEYFSKITADNFKPIFLDTNMGASVARNKGIDASKGKNIFLIDGDILYIKDTIYEYQKVLDMYPDAGCVGQNSQSLLARLGHNGVYDPAEADLSMDSDYVIEDWFPMAWTQYGLFRGEALRKIKFVEIPPFNEAGYGFEDDWLYHDLKRSGWASLAVDKPIYYHHAHSGWRELNKAGLEDKMNQRKEVFENYWGKTGWAESVRKIHDRTRRDNPNTERTN